MKQERWSPIASEYLPSVPWGGFWNRLLQFVFFPLILHSDPRSCNDEAPILTGPTRGMKKICGGGDGRQKAQHLTHIRTGGKPLIELTLTCPAHRPERRFRFFRLSPVKPLCLFFPTVLILPFFILQFSLPRYYFQMHNFVTRYVAGDTATFLISFRLPYG